MQTKVVGGHGVCKVAEYFAKLRIPVFSEMLCDNSEIDLIVVVDDKPYKLQVRSTASKKNAAVLSLVCTTPGTRRTKCKIRRFSDIVDTFALYIRDVDIIVFVDSEEVKHLKKSAVFRLDDKGRSVKNYQTPSFLKDWVPPPLEEEEEDDWEGDEEE